jgi:1,4-alpha-glucan branching enzyme
VTHGLDQGGLGFQYKWNLGWMHDFLSYLSKDPVYRSHHQNLLTFEMSYAFSERFLLVLSHDEVVHGKGSLPRKMPGDDWQKFANLRAAFAYMYAHPGKKLHFMGLEFGQWSEWNVKGFLEWHLLDQPAHRGLQTLMRDLNRLYRLETALHRLDLTYEGFQWIDFHDRDQNVLSFQRRAAPGEEKPDAPQQEPQTVVCVFNFSPVPRHNYRVGVPFSGFYAEVLNTDSEIYGGGNVGNLGGKRSEAIPMHHQPHSLDLSLPPLGALYLKHSHQEPVDGAKSGRRK